MGENRIKKHLRYLTALVPFKLRRLDAEFWRFLQLLHDNEKKSYEDMRAYQFSRLKALVTSAYAHCCFYRDKYDSAGFHPSQIKSPDDVARIPCVTKDEVRSSARRMVESSFRGRMYPDHTSGTTGTPLLLFHDKHTVAREWAAICYQWERVGYSPYDGRVEFRGMMTSEDDYYFYPDHRVLRINMIKLSDQNIVSVCRKIRKTGYKYFHGYPSALFKFARILAGNKLSVSASAIMLASENIFDNQREVIERVFPSAKIISHYGLSEKVVLGGWTNTRAYSFIPTYGMLEYDPVNGELIGTGFINEIMPFIRYKTGDFGEGFSPYPRERTLALFPVINEIRGRIDDITYSNSGEMIPASIPNFPFKDSKYISACKLIQYTLTEFELIVAAEKEKAAAEVARILCLLKSIYGDKSRIAVTYVASIPPARTGKYRFIECRINKQ